MGESRTGRAKNILSHAKGSRNRIMIPKRGGEFLHPFFAILLVDGLVFVLETA